MNMEFLEGTGIETKTGILTDTTCKVHGFIATPAYAPNGTTAAGAYTYSVDVVPGVPVFIDPSVAIGYDYQIGNGDPRFAAVRLPLGIGNNKYVLVVDGKGYDTNAGQLFDFIAHGFPQGVKAFRVACIDPAAMLNPINSLAFPTELEFAAAGRFTGTQTPLSKVRGIDAINVSRSFPDPYFAFQRMVDGRFAPPTGANWGMIKDPVIDGLVDQVLTTFDEEKRDDLLRELHARIVDQAYLVFICHDLNPRALSPKVQGFVQAQSWNQDLTPIDMK